MKIAVDAGHGGSAPGCVWDGIMEKDITLQIAKRLERALRLEGHDVVMIRRDDKTTANTTRAKLANDRRCDRYVSIHCNSVHPSMANLAEGIETLYYAGSPRGHAIAERVQQELKWTFPGHKDRGIKPRGDLTVLIRTAMPAVLVECEFLSHPARRVNLQDVTWQTSCAQAIARGIVAPLEAV